MYKTSKVCLFVQTFGISHQNRLNDAPDRIADSSVDSPAVTPRDTGIRPSRSMLRRRMSFTHIFACSTYSHELAYSDSTVSFTDRRRRWIYELGLSSTF